MGQPGRWERILSLAPGTLTIEQVATVARTLMEKANAQAPEVTGAGEDTNNGAARRGGAAKKVRL